MSSAVDFVSLDCEGRSLDIEYQWIGDAGATGPLMIFLHEGLGSLAVQGVDDEYGTLEQVHGIARRVAQAEIVELADCLHSPHRHQAQKLIGITREFVQASTAGEAKTKVGNFA